MLRVTGSTVLDGLQGIRCRMAGVYTLTMNLTSSEWIRVKQAADRQWPGERKTTA